MELLRRLRAAGNVIPVVILTAHGSIPEAVAAMKLGAIDFLTKPITPEALRRVVAEVIERHADPHRRRPAGGSHAPSPRIAPSRSRSISRGPSEPFNRGQFSEAEALLRDVIALDPRSTEAHELLDRLLTLKEQEARGSFRILRDWFPSGTARAEMNRSNLESDARTIVHDCRSQRSLSAWPFSGCSSPWSSPATTSEPKEPRMLYLTGVLTVAALFYLGYVMIRPEKILIV